MNTYRHTQSGFVMHGVLGIGIASIVILMMIYGVNPVGITVSIVLIIMLVLFRTLTVEIGDGTFTFAFGIGLIRKRIPLSDIESCAVTRIPWYYGWGIRYTPQGWLYRTSGLMAVKLMLTSGKAILVGTDDAERLRSALADAIRKASSGR